MRPEPADAAGAVDAAASCRSRGMPCSAGGHEDEREAEARPDARRRDRRAAPCPGRAAGPGDLITGNRSLIQPTFDSTPTSGWSRNSHIRLATATDVATVEENTVRKKPTPRSYLSASTASPTPSASPSGTVISANLTVTTRALLELVAAERRRRTGPSRSTGSCRPGRRSAVPEPDRLAERVEHERRRG